MRFIKLTLAEDCAKHVYLNTDHICEFLTAKHSAFPEVVTSVTISNGDNFYVTESPEQIMTLIAGLTK